MRAKAWWALGVVGLAGCGGTLEGEGVIVGAFGGPTDLGSGTVRPDGGYDAFIPRLGK